MRPARGQRRARGRRPGWTEPPRRVRRLQSLRRMQSWRVGPPVVRPGTVSSGPRCCTGCCRPPLHPGVSSIAPSIPVLNAGGRLMHSRLTGRILPPVLLQSALRRRLLHRNGTAVTWSRGVGKRRRHTVEARRLVRGHLRRRLTAAGEPPTAHSCGSQGENTGDLRCDLRKVGHCRLASNAQVMQPAWR